MATNYTAGDYASMNEQRAAWTSHFQNVMADICAHLNKIDPLANYDVWTVDVDITQSLSLRRPRFSNASGEKFWIAIDSQTQKITIYGTYGQRLDGRTWIPRDESRDEVDPQPTMDGNKTPAVLARDIARRFLPGYRRCLALYRASLKRDTDYLGGTVALFDELMTIAEGTMRPRQTTSNDTHERTADFHISDKISGTMRVSRTYVRFDHFSVSPDVARELVKVLGNHLKTA